MTHSQNGYSIQVECTVHSVKWRLQLKMDGCVTASAPAKKTTVSTQAYTGKVQDATLSLSTE